MSNTAALLCNLLRTNADINYYTQQEIYWSNLLEANSKKLQKQVKYETAYEKAYDSAIDNTSAKQAGNVSVAANNQNECLASAYAREKVPEYDKDYSETLADLDIEYDTMKTMYDTLLEELRANQEAEKQATSTAAQDTGLINQ